jgi:dUTP pyrophosphatase
MAEVEKLQTGRLGDDTINPKRLRGFEPVADWALMGSGKVIMPLRKTKNSAGYDFFNNEEKRIVLQPGEKHMFWTNVKAYMQPREVLKIYIRSSMGIKRDLELSNSTGIVDADYYSNPSNDGNIGISIRNAGDGIVYIEPGEAIAQGVFETYLVADNCNSDNERIGGIGSTDGQKGE